MKSAISTAVSEAAKLGSEASLTTNEADLSKLPGIGQALPMVLGWLSPMNLEGLGILCIAGAAVGCRAGVPVADVPGPG